MTTLLIAKDADLAGPAVQQAGLRDWLQGDWALLFSDPHDFAPPASTPSGFMVCVAEQLRCARTKPMALVDPLRPLGAGSWLHQASCQVALLVLEDVATSAAGSELADHSVVDFSARVLARKLLRLERPYVLVLDEQGRCRSTITYCSRRSDKPRTLQELLCVIAALRGDHSHDQAQHIAVV